MKMVLSCAKILFTFSARLKCPSQYMATPVLTLGITGPRFSSCFPSPRARRSAEDGTVYVVPMETACSTVIRAEGAIINLFCSLWRVSKISTGVWVDDLLQWLSVELSSLSGHQEESEAFHHYKADHHYQGGLCTIWWISHRLIQQITWHVTSTLSFLLSKTISICPF